jgi:hypothetical protein
MSDRAGAWKLVGWYVFNIVLALVASAFAVGGDGSAKGVALVLPVFGGSTAVCGYFSAARFAAGNVAGALKAARNAVPAGLLVMLALALIEGIWNVSRS